MTTEVHTRTTTTDRLRIDFLFLDLETCTRCRGTDRSLESALDAARELLAANDTEVEVNKIHVESAELARELRFESSPTIRVNGRDVALELRESSCGSEACTDGCGEAIACRVWVHAGKEYTEPPVALIVDAILREVYGEAVVKRGPDAASYELPENLERFFAGRVAAEPHQAPAQAAAAAPVHADCCSPAGQRSCCDAEDKAECCGAATGGSCGCR
jgi:Domain of unknown function (DUF2703)